MKVLVCGGRKFDDHAVVHNALDQLHSQRPITGLIEGGARGVDWLAYTWAKLRGLHDKTYPADWSQGRAAGPRRNEFMLADGNPDVVVAFPGGRGTAHMVSIARKAGVEVIEVTAP